MAQEPRIIGQGSNHGQDDEAEPVAPPGPPVGEELRQVRESMGLGIREIADTLRIREPYLTALEEGRMEDLPGTTYAIGFVRSYANHLGLDGEEAVRRFKNQVAGGEVQAELVFPEPTTESRIPRAAVVLVSVVLAASAYGGWYYLSSRDLAVGDLVPSVPENLAEETETAEAPAPLPEPSAPRAAPDADTPSPGPMPGTPPLASPAAPVPEASPSPSAAGDAGEAPGRAAAAPETESGTGPETESGTGPAVAPAPESAPRSEPEPDAEAEPAETTAMAGAGRVAGESEVASAETAAEREPGPAASGTSVRTAERRPEPQPERPVAEVTPPAPPEAPAERPESETAGVAGTEPTAPAPESGTTSETPSEMGEPQTAARPPEVVVRAKSDSWIQVRGGDGQLLVTRILRAGDSFTVPDGEGLRLMTGNAGALEILVDGEPVPPIGPFGAVRRDVVLDAERLRAGTAADR